MPRLLSLMDNRSRRTLSRLLQAVDPAASRRCSTRLRNSALIVIVSIHLLRVGILLIYFPDFLATGVVILISIAISAGIVFLILLIGVVWTLCIRHHEADTGKFIGFTEDDDSLHGPSSLLEHINAATRSTILGAGAVSPLGAAAANRESRNPSPRGGDDDPFAADPSEAHMARSNDDTIGTAIGGEDDIPRQSRVRYSFDGTGEGELPLSSGSEVAVLDAHDSAWWYVRDSSGREGVVPASYLY
jgi:hypothetical protein